MATQGEQEQNALYSGPLAFARGMLIQQEGCYRSLPGSIIKTVLKLSFAFACALPIFAISVSVVTGSDRTLTSFLMPPVFYDAREPPAPPGNVRLRADLAGNRPSDLSGDLPKARPAASLEGSPENATQYWLSNVECMRTREQVCISLMLFCFLYLAVAHALWASCLRDLDLTPAPLASCSQLRLRFTHIPHHRVEQLRRSWQRDQRSQGGQRPDDLVRRRFTSAAASVANPLSADGAENGSQTLGSLGAGERQGQRALVSPGGAARGSERGLEDEEDGTDGGGMFVMEEDLSRWSRGEIVLQSLKTQTFLAEVWHTVSVHRQRFVEVDGLSFVYASRAGVFVLATTFPEKQGLAEAVELAAAVTAQETNGNGEDMAPYLLNTIQRVLLKPEEIADRQYIGKNRLVLGTTTFGKLLWSALTDNAFYFAVLVATWYYCFTRNFLVLGFLLVFVVFEGTYRIRLLVRQQKRLQSLVAEREKTISEKPTLVLRLLRAASGPKSDVEKPRPSSPCQPDRGSSAPSFVAAWVRIPASDIVPSDIVRLSRGDVVPCDLLLVNGTVAVDESSLRGDGTPLRKGPLRASVAKLRGDLPGKNIGAASPEDLRVAESVVHAGTRVISCTEARGRSRTLDQEGLQYVFTAEDETENRSERRAFRETLGDEQRAKLARNLAGAAKTQVAAAAALMDAGASGQGGICWGVVLRTGIDTAAGQQLRQLQLPEQEMFRYDRQLVYVCIAVLALWLCLVSLHAHYTESLLLSFRFAVDSLLKLLPLWLPALCGLFATLAARRLRVCSAKEMDGFRRRVQLEAGGGRLMALLSTACRRQERTSFPSEQPLNTSETQGMHPASPGDCGGFSARAPADGSSTRLGPMRFTVVCPAPGRLPIAAKVRVVCFDKTGTLTREDFSFIGCQPVEAASLLPLVRYDPDGPPMRIRSAAASAPDAPDAPVSSEGNRNHPRTFREACASDRQVPARLFESLACCHGLALENAQVAGTGLEQQMFESTGWRMSRTVVPRQEAEGPSEVVGDSVRLVFSPAAPQGHCDDGQGRKGGLVLLQRFVFDPVRQVMSVVVARTKDGQGLDQNEGEVLVFCKGSYEAVASLCRSETVPGEFLHGASAYAKEGVYVLAAASKSLGVRTNLNAWKDLPRSEVESGLDLGGLLLFRNELRPDAADTIHQLKAARIRPVILTGDSPLTAVAVARRAGMVRGSGDGLGSDTGRLERLSRGYVAGGTTPVALGDIVDEESSGENLELFLGGGEQGGSSSGAGKGHRRRSADQKRHEAAGHLGSQPVAEHTAGVSQSERSRAAVELCQRVKWTDVDTGEEIDRWKIFFTEEYKELALTARAVEALAGTPDALMIGELGGDDVAFGDETESGQLENESAQLLWSRSQSGLLPTSESTPSSTNESSEFQSACPASTVNPKGFGESMEDYGSLLRVKQRIPTLFDRILFRVRVFARMSPHSKALIIERYQERDLIVSMVGDGTNDCFAIRQAQVGVAFGPGSMCQSIAPFAILTNQGQDRTQSASSSDPSASADQAEASLALLKSPRSNKFDSCGLLGVITLLREGRATLVTSLAVYKLQILYGILSAISYLMLTVGAYGTPNAFSLFFSSVAMLLGLSLSMIWSVPSVTPLTKRSPTSNPLGVRTVAQVTSILLVDIVALFVLFGLLYGPAGRPLPCAWVQREVRNELLQRQQIENLLDLHSLNEHHTVQTDETAAALLEKFLEDKPDDKEARDQATQNTELHDKAPLDLQRLTVLKKEKTTQETHPASGLLVASQVTPSLSFPTPEASRMASPVGNASDITLSGGQKKLYGNDVASLLKHLEETAKSHTRATAFLEIGKQRATQFLTRLSSKSFHERRVRKRSISASNMAQQEHLRNLISTTKRRTAVPLNGSAHAEAEVRYFSGPEMKSHASIEKARGAAPRPRPEVDSLLRHSLRPKAAYHDPPCSRDGRTEASIIFLWLGACLLNAAFLFSRGGTSGKTIWGNPVLMPLSFIFAVFFVFLVTAPTNHVSCVFMVNCPAHEVRMQQQRKNAVGVAKQLVTDREEKDMYRLLARNAEADVIKVRAILSVDMAAPDEKIARFHPTSLSADSSPDRASKKSASGPLETAEGDETELFYDLKARAQNDNDGSHNAKVPIYVNDNGEKSNAGATNGPAHGVQWGYDHDRRSGNGSEMSAWYGQVLLSVLCSMSVLNALIHMYVIGDQMGRDTFANWWRKAHPSRFKGEIIPV
ncbi:putative cation-transporting ATPase [Neospora caninum Liverpool]|uniref:Cation-transporting ATPase, putative n=1 Tax=Neospora caninum (strain Liverpool) TaxID=572307 RepID=F0VKP8_NEOCL|nr:putative cation-transporting ATPase [Neospora caninum Liverpool]CBZ54649.1 putative cation-transporting ATPase [Neospora caninum Liverpool]CEL69365.1 TPA: cation-transporting ATPase, putative [Neospora caninum Liverpool]|eukprot:XP_003884679.1 putative cation-transporting ATPase [Neospora caninum Liverpool]